MLKSIKNKASLLVMMASTFLMTTPVLADGENDKATNALKMVYNVMIFISGFLGVCFLFIGLIKWAISQAEGGGADQHKSLQMVAAGVVLIAIAGIIGFTSISGLLPGLQTQP